MEAKIRHLEMIQEVISRMAGNSFSLKGWAVTLVAGIFALSGTVAGKVSYLIAFMPIFIFWVLDAFYLSKERAYRALYRHVSQSKENEIDFSMDTRPFSGKENKLWRCMLSATELLFYFPLAALSAVIIILWS